MKNPRYDGKPLLRLVELWVLWVIDEIDAQDVARLTEMEPKLRQTWSLDGAWHEMIEELLQLSPAMRDELRAMWQRNLETARQQGVPAPRRCFRSRSPIRLPVTPANCTAAANTVWPLGRRFAWDAPSWTEPYTL